MAEEGRKCCVPFMIRSSVNLLCCNSFLNIQLVSVTKTLNATTLRHSHFTVCFIVSNSWLSCYCSPLVSIPHFFSQMHCKSERLGVECSARNKAGAAWNALLMRCAVLKNVSVCFCMSTYLKEKVWEQHIW